MKEVGDKLRSYLNLWSVVGAVLITQVQQRLKAEGKDPTNISLLSRETNLFRPTVRKYLKEGFAEHKNTGREVRYWIRSRISFKGSLANTATTTANPFP